MSINSVVVSGNLTRDVKFTAKVKGEESPQDRVWGILAHNDPFTGEANYFTFVAWAATARAMAAHTEKGKEVTLQGKLRHHSIGEGSDRKDYTEIVVDRCKFGPSSKKNRPDLDKDAIVQEVLAQIKGEEGPASETTNEEPQPEVGATEDSGSNCPF